MNRDERAIITTALERAGYTATLDETRGFPVASFSWASPQLPGGARFTVDAPSGWLRVATTLDATNPETWARHALGLLYTETGFGHVHHDTKNGVFRIAASLQAVDEAPSGSALIAACEHLARVRHKMKTGEGDVRAVPDPAPLPDEPALADAARALGTSLSLVEEKDASFVGGLHEPRSGSKCALRIHTATPGIFAFDAWGLPPARIAVVPSHIERVDTFNASLDAGAMMLFQDGFLLYRWACPYRWLDVGQLATPIAAHVALDALMRWRR
jgi:hypothetical protein